jgi:lipid A 3-O-deacylase
MRRVLSAVPILLLATARAEAQPCLKSPGHFVAQIENDLRGISFRDSDSAYTAGERFLWANVGLGDTGKGPLRTTWPFKHKNGSCLAWTVGIASSLYTPANIETAAVQARDRPYGAWLYGMYRLSQFHVIDRPDSQTSFDIRRADSIELDVGILGPGAAGKYFQNTVHKLFGVTSRVGPGIKLALGWHHQLRNEAALNLHYLRRQRVAGAPASDPSRHYDVILDRGGAFGTIFTWLNGAGTFRFGTYVPNDLGPYDRPPTFMVTARPRSGTDVSGPEDEPDGASDPPVSRQSVPPTPKAPPKQFLYGFVRLEGRAVLRNAFLDGNLFADDRPDRGRVQKRPVVGDLDVGFVLQPCKYFSVTYHNVLRSPEFKRAMGAPVPPDATSHRFGSLTFQIGRLY